MKSIGLGKRQGFANEASRAVPQGIEPVLDMVGFTTGFTDRLMLVCHKNELGIRGQRYSYWLHAGRR